MEIEEEDEVVEEPFFKVTKAHISLQLIWCDLVEPSRSNKSREACFK